ncbi:MAG: Wzt carbohydrate-binding domain-containing protein [Phreatobacter sp.]
MAAKENALLSVEQRRVKGGWLHTRSGSYAAVVSHVDLVDDGTRAPVSTATVGQKLVLTLTVDAAEDIETLVVGVMMRERTGHIVWGTNTWHSRQTMKAKAGDRVICEIAFACDLGPGSYSVSTALTSSETHLSDNYEWQDNMLVFDVVNVDRPFFIGSTALEASITLTNGRTDGPA